MAMEVNKGNFEFVREIYEDVCDKLQEAEKNCRDDYEASGAAIRIALEDFVFSLEGTSNSEMADLSDDNLYKKINALVNDGKFYKNKFYCKNYETISGKINSCQWYHFIRFLGNECHHSKNYKIDPDRDPIVNYENILKALKIMFQVMKQEYERLSKQKKLSSKLLQRKFSEDLMPIGDRYILEAYEPVDAEVSNCIKEYMTISFNEHGETEFYSVVRVYNKKNGDMGMLRDKDAFSQALRNLEDIKFDGNVILETISKMDNPKSEFYIVAYRFLWKPELLFEMDLNKADLDDRKKLCYEIAKILRKFHNLSTPIYIRNLSYDSIYIPQNKNGTLEPSIIKLDYAKIESTRTRYYELKDNVKIRIASRDKYWDPQVLSMIENSKMMSINWEKADVYSLGVLFGDILSGSTQTTRVVSGQQLKNLNADLEGYAEIINKMINREPDARPSAKEVVEMLEGEQKNGIGI